VDLPGGVRRNLVRLLIESRISDLLIRRLQRTSGRPSGSREGAGRAIVIEGSIRESGPRVRVNVQLLDAESGTHLCAEHFDRDISGGEVFTAQDELTDGIVATVADTYGVLSRSLAARVKEKPVEQLTAYESVLLMFGYWQPVTPNEHAEVRTALERALEREPNHAGCVGVSFLGLRDRAQIGFQPASRSVGACARRGARREPIGICIPHESE